MAQMSGRPSTREERHARAVFLLDALTGYNEAQWAFHSRRKPSFFPTGLNYTVGEWSTIHSVRRRVVYTYEVSILQILELEEMKDNPKYQEWITLHILQT